METDFDEVEDTELELDAVDVDDAEEDADGGEDDTEYTPSYNYKVLDEEREFDERLKAAIKDKDTEAYVRDLYTKADGLETYKQKYGALEGQAKTLVQGFNQLKELRDNNDIKGLSGALGVTEEQLIDYVRTVLHEEALPSKDKEALDRQRQLEEDNRRYKAQLDTFTSTQKNAAIEQDVRELETLIETPTVAGIASAMTKHGIDIVEEVLKEGHFEFTKTGKEPTVKTVVDRVAKKYSYLTNTAPVKKQVLPNVKGGGSSMLGKPVTSIAQLREMSNAMFTKQE